MNNRENFFMVFNLIYDKTIFDFRLNFGYTIFDSANVNSGKGEIKRELSAGRNNAVVGRKLLLAGGGSDPHEFIQEIGLSGSGYLEVLPIAHDHLSSITPDVLFDLLQVDERGIMNTEKMIVAE